MPRGVRWDEPEENAFFDDPFIVEQVGAQWIAGLVMVGIRLVLEEDPDRDIPPV